MEDPKVVAAMINKMKNSDDIINQLLMSYRKKKGWRKMGGS